ncbi:hypothetical protein OEZ86_007210 [Tetradesmus obliquus]|nr:hypothetical protein OEZ86_007210 [Tetradesmus obliquus]
MPQKKAKKRGDNGFSLQLQKVGGYAYTKKFIELQALVRSLQAQAEAAKQQVEDSQQREMVLLDLTVHQEQILSLFHHQILSSSGPLSHMQQLEQLVDEWVTLSALALILHPLPVYVASTMNHATQLPCAIPEGHHDRVVRRMQLTQQQVRHFAAVLDEISRLDDVVMAQGGQLARNAACPNTLLAKCVVASYPFIPLTGAIAASAAKLHHQQQRHRQLQRQQQQQDCEDSVEEQQQHDAAAAAEAEAVCYGIVTAQDVLHVRERLVLQQRRLMLDSQLQQWRDQLQALGLADS